MTCYKTRNSAHPPSFMHYVEGECLPWNFPPITSLPRAKEWESIHWTLYGVCKARLQYQSKWRKQGRQSWPCEALRCQVKPNPSLFIHNVPTGPEWSHNLSEFTPFINGAKDLEPGSLLTLSTESPKANKELPLRTLMLYPSKSHTGLYKGNGHCKNVLTETPSWTHKEMGGSTRHSVRIVWRDLCWWDNKNHNIWINEHVEEISKALSFPHVNSAFT